MSTLDTLLDGVELVERVAGDAAHTAPITRTVFKLVWKRFSAKGIQDNAILSKRALQDASDRLTNPTYKPALEAGNFLTPLTLQYAEMCVNLKELEKDIQNLKFYEIRRKKTLYSNSVEQRLASEGFKDEVYETSSWVTLNLQLAPDGTLIPMLVRERLPPYSPAGSPSQSPSPLHSPAPSTDYVLELRHDLDASSTAADPSELHSDTDSIFGNPWLRTSVENPATALDTDSETDVTTTAVDKGKGRAE